MWMLMDQVGFGISTRIKTLFPVVEYRLIFHMVGLHKNQWTPVQITESILSLPSSFKDQLQQPPCQT